MNKMLKLVIVLLCTFAPAWTGCGPMDPCEKLEEKCRDCSDGKWQDCYHHAHNSTREQCERLLEFYDEQCPGSGWWGP
jgi:hypothetical protein